jgi:hypothetical protein
VGVRDEDEDIRAARVRDLLREDSDLAREEPIALRDPKRQSEAAVIVSRRSEIKEELERLR